VPGIKRQSGSVTLVVLLIVVFLATLLFSLRGWGYMGYYGYNRGPSFWYWGGPKVYHNPSLRNGSTGGPNNRGGGFAGGK
jgi:hypothetical protein